MGSKNTENARNEIVAPLRTSFIIIVREAPRPVLTAFPDLPLRHTIPIHVRQAVFLIATLRVKELRDVIRIAVAGMTV